MTSEHFCRWLSGYLQLERPKTLSEKQIGIIEDHLKLAIRGKPDYYVGDPSQPIPMWDEVAKNGKKIVKRYYC